MSEFIKDCIKQRQSIEEQIRDGKLIVDDIPLYKNLKINLKHLRKQYLNIIDTISEYEKYPEGIICPLSYYLDNSKSTFLSPAYLLNNYLDTLTEYTIKYLNRKTQLGEEEIFKEESTIIIQNLFISIKCLLDRLVPIISFYYKGLSLTSTFGRIKEDNKSSGLMGRVIQDKEKDDMFQYIYEEYNEWIKDIVAPRDVVIHYNDMELRTQPTADGRIIIFHIENKIFNDDKGKEGLFDEPSEHYYKSIAKHVERLYTFYKTIFNFLKSKDIIYTKQHFENEELFKKYIDMKKEEISNTEKKLRVECKICGRLPEEISEYIYSAEEEKITPTQYVVKNDGTYNKVTGEFYCTECYVNEQFKGNIY